jgi:hypothetical protein
MKTSLRSRREDFLFAGLREKLAASYGIGRVQ